MARRLLYLFVASCFLFPTTALAQRGQQALDIILQQADRELQRQQQLQQQQRQRELERAQWQQEMNRRIQQYPADRQACHRGDPTACERAITSPSLTQEDRGLLIMQRDALIAARQAAAERDRARRIDSELAEQNRIRQEQIERDQAAERARRQAETQAVAARPTLVPQVNAQLTTSALASTIDI